MTHTAGDDDGRVVRGAMHMVQTATMESMSVERAQLIWRLALEEVGIEAVARAAYSAEPDFGRRHSVGRKWDGVRDTFGTHLDEAAMTDTECAEFERVRADFRRILGTDQEIEAATFADGSPVTDADRAEDHGGVCQGCGRAPARWVDGSWWDCLACAERVRLDEPDYR